MKRRKLPQFLPDPPRRQIARDIRRALAPVMEREGGRKLLNKMIEEVFNV